MKALPIVLILLGLVGLCGLISPADGLLFGGTVAMAGTVIAFLLAFRSPFMRLVRWSKTHLLQSQVILTILQVCLVPMSLYGGYNLHKLGVEFSQMGYWVFGAIFVLSVFHIPLFIQHSWLTLPKKFLRQRFAVLGMSVSAIAILSLLGNHIPEQRPESNYAHWLEKADHLIFPADEYQPGLVEFHRMESRKEASIPLAFHFTSQRNDGSQAETLEKEMSSSEKLKKLKKRKRRKLRKVVGAGICVLSVLLVILFSGMVCAAICLIILSESVGGVLLGVAALPVGIWGIYASIQMCARGIKKSKEKKAKKSS